MRAIAGLGVALLLLVPLAALATRRRSGDHSAARADRVATAVLRGILVLAAFVLVILVVILVRG
ncbi:MAG: hypothetical protein ACRC50_02305 [Gaiella sp.]